MSVEIVPLIDKFYLMLVVVLLIGGIAGMQLERLLSEMRRRAWRDKNRWRWERKKDGGNNIANEPWGAQPDPAVVKRPDAADQLRIVMGANFTIQPLLNKREARLFRELERIITGCNPEWQVMAQVSLGEILRSNDKDAYGCVNSKRVDLLIVDENCRPRHAIEYQGGAHYQGSAAARDAVKREALRRAGVGYHEVRAGHTTPSELRRLVEKLVGKPTAAE